MIERGAFVPDAWIGERFEERYQIAGLPSAQAKHFDVGVLGTEWTPAVVIKLHNVIQRKQRTIVEVWSGQFYVSQTGGFKGSVYVQTFIRPEIGGRRNK